MLIVNQYGHILHDLPEDVRDFTGLNLRGAQMAGFDLEGARFDDTDLTGANLTGADLYWAVFDGAICDECSFALASLRGAIFHSGSFVRADFRGADFSNDNLDDSANLYEIDLSTALLEGALYTDETHKIHTVFPEDFDPVSRGMKPYAGPAVR